MDKTVWSVEELLATARAETGLSDFGDDSFRQGLDRFVHALDTEALLSGAGQTAMRAVILKLLSQRLQVEDWYRRHPEIDDERIEAPVIGVGLPRTASTALSALLAADPEARSLLRWEAAEPCPPPSTVRGPDARVERMRAEVAQRSSRRNAFVPAAAESAQECQMLLAFDFKALYLQGFAGHVPSYSKWLLEEADLTPAYEYERRVLKLLQWGAPAKPWRLKCPQHLLRLADLNQVFPDARLVMMHREAVEMVVSWSDLMVEVGRPFCDDIDLHYVGALNAEMWSVGMQRALEFRDTVGDERFYDIGFRAMQRDPVGVVRGLYAWLGQSVSKEFEQGMQRWWHENAERRERNAHREPEDFGLDREQLAASFADYTTRMGRWFEV